MHEILHDERGMLRIQSWNVESQSPPLLEEAMGAAWPRTTGSVARGRGDILCIGPTDWLIIAVDLDFAGLKEAVEKALEKTSFAATNVSQSLSRIVLRGAQIRDLLAKGCSLDLHPSIFPPGCALRTRFAGIPVIVRFTASHECQLIVSRSLREYLAAWLADAAIEFEASAP